MMVFGGRSILALLGVLLLVCSRVASAQADERILYASVVDRDGAPVLDLTAKDFVVREDGVSREILRVGRDTDPLQIALLVDNSATMESRLTEIRRALGTFVDATRGGVEIALITLAERPTIAVAYTSDRATLHKAIDRLFAYSVGNYLLDGIAETSQGLSKHATSRAAIVAIIGGGPELSYRQYTEVLRFLREGGATLHVLALDVRGVAGGREIVLGKGTAETGGRYENIVSPAALEPKAKQMATEVSNQYRVTYARPERLIPPKTTEVSVKRQDLKARGMPIRTDKDK